MRRSGEQARIAKRVSFHPPFFVRKPMSVNHPMPPELERKLYYDGITLFNEHEFFEAHEVWEDVWHMAYGLKHYYYQGLIQCTVALELYRRSNPRGVVSLY